MGFTLLLIYLFLAFIRPYELFPALVPLRLMQVFGVAALLATLSHLPFSPVTYRAKQLYLMLLFSMLVIISPVIALRWLGGALNAFGEFGITVVVFLVTIINVSTVKRLGIVLRLLAIVGLLLVVQSVLALHFGVFANLLIMRQPIADGEYIIRLKATGFMTDPNDLAQTLVMAFPFVGLAWKKHHLPRNFLLVLLPMAFLLYGIYLTRSRGALLSLAALVLLGATKKLGRITGAVLTGGAVMVALMVNFTGGRAMAGSDASATNRLEAWSDGIQMLKAHPLTGVGYANFTTHHHGLTAHNSAVLAFSELGLPTFIVWVALIIIGLLEMRALDKLVLKAPEDVKLQRYARAVFLGFMAFLVSAWFLSRTYIMTLYLLVALSGAVSDIARQAKLPIGVVSSGRLARLSVGVSVGLLVFIYFTIKFAIR